MKFQMSLLLALVFINTSPAFSTVCTGECQRVDEALFQGSNSVKILQPTGSVTINALLVPKAQHPHSIQGGYFEFSKNGKVSALLYVDYIGSSNLNEVYMRCAQVDMEKQA